MRIKDLRPGKLYQTVFGDARFTGFDGLGYVACVRLSDGMKLQLISAQVLAPLAPAAPACVAPLPTGEPVSAPFKEGEPCR